MNRRGQRCLSLFGQSFWTVLVGPVLRQSAERGDADVLPGGGHPLSVQFYTTSYGTGWRVWYGLILLRWLHRRLE